MLSPKRDTKVKSPPAQSKVSKTSPLATTRNTNLATGKGSPTLLRQSPTAKKALTEKEGVKGKLQNTSLKDL